MKKVFLMISMVSVFLMMSCELFFEKNDTNTNSSSSSSESFLVITNEGPYDRPIAGISSIMNANRSARTERQAAVLEPEYDGPQIIDVNFDNTELLGLLKESAKSEISPDYTLISNPNNANVAVGDTAQFWCFDRETSFDDSSKVAKYEFVAKAVGKKCIIWACNGTFVEGAAATDTDHLTEPQIPDSKFTELAASLDSVFTKEMSIFGSNVLSSSVANLIATNANTKLNVLIYDICGDGLNTNKTAIVGGLFYSADFCLQSWLTNNTNSSYRRLKSNQCECIHADSYIFKNDAEKNKKSTTSTLLHEFQHMLHFINKQVKYDIGTSTWFNEMLSMSAEDIFQTQLGLSDADSPKSRMSTFNSGYFAGFKNWRSGNDVLYSYANAYAFGAYLMRNYGGIKLINQIATNSYADDAAITAALKQLGYSEEYTSVLRKFENVIVYPDAEDKPNLLKSVTEGFGGVNYSLTPIQLMNYITVINESQKDYYYDIDNRYYTRDGNSYIRGPVILNKGYYHNSVLGPGGTYVLFYGWSSPDITEENGLYQRVLEK